MNYSDSYVIKANLYLANQQLRWSTKNHFKILCEPIKRDSDPTHKKCLMNDAWEFSTNDAQIASQSDPFYVVNRIVLFISVTAMRPSINLQPTKIRVTCQLLARFSYDSNEMLPPFLKIHTYSRILSRRKLRQWTKIMQGWRVTNRVTDGRRALSYSTVKLKFKKFKTNTHL